MNRATFFLIQLSLKLLESHPTLHSLQGPSVPGYNDGPDLGSE